MKKIWFAHRGYHQKFVENNFGAFQAAYENNFSGVELDLRLTQSGEIVIFHDDSTKRLSDSNLTIEDASLTELQNILFYKKRRFFRRDSNKEKILTLDKFLKTFYDKFTCIDLELKSERQPFVLEQKLLATLSAYPDFRQKVIVTSFNLISLINLHSLDKDLPLGFLICNIEDLKINLDSLRSVCKYLCVPEKVFEKNLKFFQKLNFPVITWNVRQKSQYRLGQKNDLVFGQIMDKKLFV